MKIIKILTLIFLVAFASGCPILDNLQKATSSSPQTFKSKDGICEVTAPGNWKPRTDLHESSTLSLANLREEQYFMVLPEAKSDFDVNMDTSRLALLMIENYKDTSTSEVPIQNASYTAPQFAFVNGKGATRFEINGTVSGIKASYVITVAEGKDHFYQIVTWTLTSKFERNKPVLVATSDSFRESAIHPATAKR